jgi:O-antigen/teichoic acid export membrane protein
LELKNSIQTPVVWKALSLFSLFILNILFARYFAAAASGWVFYLFTVNSFIVQLLGFSLESGISYYTARKSIRESRLVNFSLIWTLLVSVVTLALYLMYSWKYPTRVEYPILYPIAFVAGSMLIAFGNAFYYSKNNFVTPYVLGLIVNVTLVVFLIYSFEYSKVEMPMAFIPVYFYSFLVHGLILFFTLFVVSKEDRFLLSIKPKYVRKIFRYSKYAFIVNLLFLGMTRVDYFFIRYNATAQDLGNYIQVSKIAFAFFLLPAIVSNVLFPLVVSGSQPEVKKSINRFSGKLFLLYAGICALLAATGNWLFPMVFGPSYAKMYPAFLLIIPGILSMAGLYPYTTYFAGDGRIRVNMMGCLFAFTFVLIADYFFIPRYGINGAALISSIGYFIYYCYVFLVFKKETRIEKKDSLAGILISQQT